MEASGSITQKTVFIRNKKRSSKFSSSEDARTSRAVQRKLEQKKQRNFSLTQYRSIATPHQKVAASISSVTPLTRTNSNLYSKSITSTTNKYSKNELEKLGRMRYQEMLQWKKEKSKLIEMEKKKRLPSFVSGVYKPDAPKFLVSNEDEPSIKSTTPWKSTSKQNIKFSSISNSTARVYDSKSYIGNSKACKPLEFSKRTTPLAANSNLCVEVKGLKCGRMLRSSKPVLPHLNNFDMSPLPLTPLANIDKLRFPKGLSKPTESFAPNLFRFEAPAGLKLYDFSFNKKTKQLKSPAISEDADDKSKIHCRDFTMDIEKTYGAKVPVEVQQTLEIPIKAQHDLDVQIEAQVVQQTLEVSTEALQAVDVPIEAQQTLDISTEAHQTLEVPTEARQMLDVPTEAKQTLDINFETLQAQVVPKEIHNSVELSTESFSVEVPIDSKLNVTIFKETPQTVDIHMETCVNISIKTQQNDEISMGSPNAVDVPIEAQYKLGNSAGVSSKVKIRPILTSPNLCEPVNFKPSVENEIESPLNFEGEDRSAKDFEYSTVSTQQTCEPVIQVCFELKTECNDEDNISSCILEEMSLKLSDSSDTDADDFSLPLCEVSKLVEDAGQTPAPVRLRKTRFSLASISEKERKIFFSPTSRLRPRTPCSRSTRRSHSAHCDHFSLDSLVTPNKRSTKKQRQSSLCKSFNNITNNAVSTENIATPTIIVTPASLENSRGSSDGLKTSSFKTPLSHIVKKKKNSGHCFRVSSLIDTSPWINKSRGSTSSKGKQRRSIFSNELESMFNDLPLDGSLPASFLNEIGISASPILNQSAIVPNCSPLVSQDDPNCSLKENLTPELKKFLQPSTRLFQEKYKQDVLVWTPDSTESSPAYLPKRNLIEGNEKIANLLPASTNILFDDNCHREPLTEISVAGNVIKGRRRTRKASVTFSDNCNSSEKTGCKFPTTPIAQSARVSLGIFSDIRKSDSLSQSIKPGEDLIQWDSPIASVSGLLRKSQSRGTHRIELPPGLEPCNEKEDYISVRGTHRMELPPGLEPCNEKEDYISVRGTHRIELPPGLEPCNEKEDYISIRGTHRIELPPGLEPCNEKEENKRKASLPSEGDLMSFDTPSDKSVKKKNKRISRIGTPLRRSKRVSHVPPP